MAVASSYQTLDLLSASDLAAAGVSPDEAQKIHRDLAAILRESGGSAPEAWRRISKGLLRPDHPFALHQALFYGCYRDTTPDAAPAWIPDLDEAVLTNIGRILQARGSEFLGSGYKDPISSFADFQKFSVVNREVFIAGAYLCA